MTSQVLVGYADRRLRRDGLATCRLRRRPNDGGRVVATLSFLESGELHGIELLDVQR